MSKIILLSENGTVILLGDKSEWKEIEVSNALFEFLIIDPACEYSDRSRNLWKPIYDGEETIEEAFGLTRKGESFWDTVFDEEE